MPSRSTRLIWLTPVFAIGLSVVALLARQPAPRVTTNAQPTSGEWVRDTLLGDQGFFARTIALAPDDDGPVRATLVRRPLTRSHGCAVLYIHGYVDYFFQPHLADYFESAPVPSLAQGGCDFFALDLRRYGRSLTSGEPYPNFVRSLDSYFSEITQALAIIGEGRYSFVMMNGHSTGGLVVARYLQDGERKGDVHAAFLNSPFLDFSRRDLNALTRPLAPVLGWIAPHGSRPSTVPLWYARSLLIPSACADCHGRWTFSLALKPIEGFRVFFGWVRAILAAQDRAREGGITQPILVLHSARSDPGTGDEWREEYGRTDIVLDERDIERDSPKLGTRVTVRPIEGGVHDLSLSQPDAQAQVFAEVSNWLKGLSIR